MVNKKSTSPAPRRGKHPRRVHVIPVLADPPFESLLQVNAVIAAQNGLIESLQAEIGMLDEHRHNERDLFEVETEEVAQDNLATLLPRYPLDSLSGMRWGNHADLEFGFPWQVRLTLWSDCNRQTASFEVHLTGWNGLDINSIDDFHAFATAVRGQVDGLRNLAEILRARQLRYQEDEQRYNERKRQLLDREQAARMQLAIQETVRLLLGLTLEPGPDAAGKTFPFRLEAKRWESFEWLRVTAVNEDRTIAEVTGRFRESISKGPGYGRIPTGKSFTITRYARVATMCCAFLNLINNDSVVYRFRG